MHSVRRTLQLAYLLLIMLALLFVTLAVPAQANAQAQTTHDIVTQAALEHGIEPELALAIMEVESGGNENVVGALGEVGLFQLRPTFHDARHGDRHHNVGVALRYLADLKTRFEPSHGDAWFVAFNVGPTRMPRLKEPTKTQYYKRVTTLYRERAARKQANRLQLLPFMGVEQ